MAPSGSSVRLVGGPAAVDGTVSSGEVVDGGVILIAVHGSRWCPLRDLDQQCGDRASTERLAGAWLLARYEIWGRPRRLRPQLYRHTGTFALIADRDGQGHWSLQPGLRHQTSTGGTGRTSSAGSAAPSAGGGGTAEVTVWVRLEDEVDQAALRFRRVVDLLPDGALADRALGAVRSGDACVADAARLCAVGATVSPGWQPGSPDDEAVSLVTRITSLLGTIDAATREVVRLHLELGDPEPPAEDLALLAASVAELEAATDDRRRLGP
jgi:hypothetical protein